MRAFSFCYWTRTASCGACCESTSPAARRSQVRSLNAGTMPHQACLRHAPVCITSAYGVGHHSS